MPERDALGSHLRNRAQRGAWRKGVAAARAGKPKVSPYVDILCGRYQHIVTYSRGFRRCWFEGYDWAKENG